MQANLRLAPDLAATPMSLHLDHLRDALEQHEPGSVQHATSVARLSFWLAHGLGRSLPYCAALQRAAIWHDVGKLAIPQSCLQKPGALNDAEWTIMRLHARLGAALLAPQRFPELALAAQVALEHHERFDGSGYPFGLRGARISLAARIVAVADVFDALASVRCYKPAWPLERIERHFRTERGRAFDPEVVDVLLAAPELAYWLRGEAPSAAQAFLRKCA